MKSSFLIAALFGSLTVSMIARADVLDRPVTLKVESDLVEAISVTLQHAVTTSERYRGKEPRLERFARKEIVARRRPIEQLNKLGRIRSTSVKQLAIDPKDDASYLRAMLRNHARIIELAEFGAGMSLSPGTKRLIEALARDATAEFTMLRKLEKS